MLWVVLGIAIVLAALVGWAAYVTGKIEHAVPAQGQYLEVPGARIHYVDLGPRDAPAIVMVHGILGNIRNFTYAFADRLAADHRVIVIDRPGWGYSTLTGPRPDLAEQARMVADFSDGLGLETPLLVGHSMGGAVALALALSHPKKVRALALIAPYTQPIERPPEPFKGLVVPGPLRTILSWTLAIPIAMRTGKTKTAQVFHPDPAPADFGTRGGGLLGMRPQGFQSATFEMGIAVAAMEAQAPRYGAIGLPVAILYGRDDALLDPELHGTDTAAAIPGATIELVEGGHMLPVTHAEVTEAWLRRVAG